MLSREDIEKELGKGISIYPFNYDNFKENSINLSASDCAWTLGEGKVLIDYGTGKAVLSHEDKDANINFKKGDSAVIEIRGTKYILLLPHSTTLIETVETIAIGPNIGGTYHSKVGLVSLGLGHIGTMIGPNFTGRSLVAVHNVVNEIIILKVNDTFVSVVLHYLNTSLKNTINPTISGHVEKLSEYGIKITQEQRESLVADWQSKKDEIKQKMMSSGSYNEYIKQKRKNKNTLKSYFTKRNAFIILGLSAIVAILLIGGYLLDKNFSTTDWSNRAWSIIGSGIFVTIIAALIKCIKK